MDTDRLAVLLRDAYGDLRNETGQRKREVFYTRLEALCDGAAAVLGCTSIEVQECVILARKAYMADDKPGRDKRYRDDLNARIKELMV